MCRLLALLSVAVVALFAQPNPAAPPPVLSPEVHPDRSITFRLLAPQAKNVQFVGDWLPTGQSLPMQKNEAGLWTYTTPPMAPNVYIYSFLLDGLSIADPINPRIKLRARTSASMVEVPASTASLWDPRGVPHGDVQINFHRATALGGETRSFWVYTPPGYAKSKQSYPVLYLLHGSNDTAGGWVLAGHANFILDNLLADGKLRPMIVVMPFGHAVPFGSPREVQATNTDAFERYLFTDLVPAVESKYRLLPGRAARAIAGLSMGGGQSLAIGLKHADRFSAIAAFSAAVPEKMEDRLAALSRQKSTLLWFACGDQDFLLQRSRDLDALLQQRQIPHTYRQTPGGHTYSVWRQYLAEFAPLLFR